MKKITMKIMKITIKKKMVDEIVEISDKLIDKTIAIIDELLDRTWDDWEARGWSDLDFPLVPFPFFKKDRLPENIGVDDYWIGFWLGTELQKIIVERTTIIETLKKMEGIESIKHNPVINLTAPVFDGDKFKLCINRSKLVSLRELIIERQQKLKIEWLKKNSKVKNTEKIKDEIKAKKTNNNQIKSVTIIKPKNSDGSYKLLVNGDYKNIKTIRNDSSRLKTFIKIIEDNDLVPFNKDIFDYFNFDKRCPIYFGGNYELTNLLEQEGNYLKARVEITKEIITEKTYKQRLKKLSST